MKGGEVYSTHECNKPPTVKPKCSNCGGIISRSLEDAQRTLTTLITGSKGEIRKYRNNESNGLKHLKSTKKDNAKRVNTEDELNLALGVMLRDYFALNAPEEMQRNFILKSKKD